MQECGTGAGKGMHQPLGLAKKDLLGLPRWERTGGMQCSLWSLMGSAVNGEADPSLQLPHPGAVPSEAALGWK